MTVALLVAYGIGALIAAWALGSVGEELSLELVGCALFWPILVPLSLAWAAGALLHEERKGAKQ